MKRFILFLTLFISLGLYAENIQEITNPSAGILQKGEAKLYTRIYKENGMIVGASVGFFEGFMFGVSFGAEQLVGDQKPLWHNKVDFNAKFRLFDETLKAPALAFGFDSQGNGTYHKDAERYDIKSKGFYAVSSKNFALLGLLGLDAGLNYSLEQKEENNNLNVFCGSYKTIGDKITAFAEYDFAINDNSDSALSGKGNGYFNLGAQLNINEQFSIKVLAHDIFQNRPDTESFDRAIQINYRWKY